MKFTCACTFHLLKSDYVTVLQVENKIMYMLNVNIVLLETNRGGLNPPAVIRSRSVDADRTLYCPLT